MTVGTRTPTAVLLFSVAALVPLLTSCSTGGANDLTSGEYHVLVSAPADGGDDAGIGGTVGLVGKCLGIGGSVAFWPSGTEIVADDPLTIDVPGIGEVSVGDKVSGGGGSHAWPVDSSVSTVEPEVSIPDSCPTTSWVTFRSD